MITTGGVAEGAGLGNARAVTAVTQAARRAGAANFMVLDLNVKGCKLKYRLAGPGLYQYVHKKEECVAKGWKGREMKRKKKEYN